MSGSGDPYHALLMDRARNPRHAGRPAACEAEAEGENPPCGDRTRVFLSAGDGGLRVRHVSRGCAIMAASADLMAEAVAGLSPTQVAQRRAAFEAVVTTGTPDPSLGDLNALAGLAGYRSRIRCATLPWTALAEALRKETADG